MNVQPGGRREAPETAAGRCDDRGPTQGEKRGKANQIITVVFTVQRSIFRCAEGIFSYQILNIHGQWIFLNT